MQFTKHKLLLRINLVVRLFAFWLQSIAFLLRPASFYSPLQPLDPNPYDPGAQRSHLWPITFSLHWHWPPIESQISVPFTSRLVPVGSQLHATRKQKFTVKAPTSIYLKLSLHAPHSFKRAYFLRKRVPSGIGTCRREQRRGKTLCFPSPPYSISFLPTFSHLNALQLHFATPWRPGSTTTKWQLTLSAIIDNWRHGKDELFTYIW